MEPPSRALNACLIGGAPNEFTPGTDHCAPSDGGARSAAHGSIAFDPDVLDDPLIAQPHHEECQAGHYGGLIPAEPVDEPRAILLRTLVGLPKKRHDLRSRLAAQVMSRK